MPIITTFLGANFFIVRDYWKYINNANKIAMQTYLCREVLLNFKRSPEDDFLRDIPSFES